MYLLISIFSFGSFYSQFIVTLIKLEKEKNSWILLEREKERKKTKLKQEREVPQTVETNWEK